MRFGRYGIGFLALSAVFAFRARELSAQAQIISLAATAPSTLAVTVTSGAVHFYISQSDKGELVMGGDLDFCNSYSQRGNLPVIEHVVGACLALFPCFGRLKVMRTWGGVCDMTMDGSPIIGALPVKGLTMTGGWCYGGFKATPASGWLHAYTIARGEPQLIRPGVQSRPVRRAGSASNSAPRSRPRPHRPGQLGRRGWREPPNRPRPLPPR